jgi:DNA-binding NtrC family response regulator
MSGASQQGMRDRSLLLVEDEYTIAFDLAQWLEELGIKVIGPAGSVADALRLIEINADKIDGALLDINLRGERVDPVAEALGAMGLPFAFISGYDDAAVAARYADAQRYEKPVDRGLLAEWLATAFNSCARSNRS